MCFPEQNGSNRDVGETHEKWQMSIPVSHNELPEKQKSPADSPPTVRAYLLFVILLMERLRMHRIGGVRPKLILKKNKIAPSCHPSTAHATARHAE